MFNFYVFLSSNVQNCINELDQISHFVFYIIRFILSGDTRMCIGILFGASAHLFTCAPLHLPPSAAASWTQANSSSCLWLLSDRQNVKKNKNCSSTLHCNNLCIFTVYLLKCIVRNYSLPRPSFHPYCVNYTPFPTKSLIIIEVVISV